MIVTSAILRSICCLRSLDLGLLDHCTDISRTFKNACTSLSWSRMSFLESPRPSRCTAILHDVENT